MFKDCLNEKTGWKSSHNDACKDLNELRLRNRGDYIKINIFITVRVIANINM